MAKGLSAAKAKKILEDGYVKGKPLTAKQKKYFGAIASGATPLKAINGAGVPKAQLGLANKLYKFFKGTDNVADVANTVRKTSNVVDNAWTVKPLPGLHLKSTMNNGAISKIIQPKTGFINTEQALAIINKESGGPAKVALIRQQLGDNIPKKMDYNEFRAATQKSLIPLEVKINPSGNSDYGLENIGYDPWKVEHEALTISNRDQFGTGSSMHDNPDDTLGHVHFLKDADDPNTLTITQIQSDAFQGQYNTKQTKEQLERSLSSNKKHAEAQKKLHARAVQDPDSRTWTYPDGMVLTNNAYKEALDGQKNWNKMQQADIDNYSQKQLLAKNHEERYLQEIVNYAGANGNNKIRIPTMETAAKVQDFNDMQKNMGVLKKYKNQPKTIKKLYGQDVITVTDNKGNTWYEFDIPESFKSGTGEIKAFKEGGWLDKFDDGGSVPKAQTGMMYARTSGTSPEEPKKAQDGTVMYGTPEYKKAYEEGTFADVPNQLDEVVMYSGIDYEKYPYYNDLSAEQRKYFDDDGPIGRGIRRAAYTKKGLAEDTYDVVNPLMYGMLGLAGGMAAGPALSTLGRGAAPYVSRYAINPIQRALSYKPLGGPVSIGNVVDGGSAAYAAYATPGAYDKFKENPSFDTGLDLGLTAIDLVPFSEIFTGGKNIKNLYNKGKNLFTKTPTPAVSNAIDASIDPGIRQGLANLNDELGIVNTTSSQIRASEKFNKNWFNHPDVIKKTEQMLNQPSTVRANMSEVEILQDINMYNTMLDKTPNLPAKLQNRIRENLKDLNAGLAKRNLETVQQKGRFTEVFDENNLNHQDMGIHYDENLRTLGLYKGRTNQASVHVKRIKEKAKDVGSVITHEDLHAITAGKSGYTDEAKDILNSALGKDQDWWLNKINTTKDQKKREELIDRLEYLARPQEIHARVHELRKAFNLKPGQEVSPSKIEAIMTKGLKGETPVDEDFFRLLGDKENFRKIFNKLPAFVPAAVGLGAATQNKNGGKTPKAQYGIENKYPLPKRKGVRLNYDEEGNVNGESTHIMKAEIVDGKWYGFPTLFQNDDDSWDNTFELLINKNEKNWMPAFKEAKRRGELIEFGDDMESAIKFGEGSWKPKMKNGGWLSKYENGGVIEDDRGQWAHPGKVTKINSNNITMKGVDYPVLGVSNTGDKKMMQPGKDYKFDGNSVTEYPMAQDGLNAVPDSTPQINFMKDWASSAMHNKMLNASSSSDKFKNKVKSVRSNFDDVTISMFDDPGYLGQYLNSNIRMNPSLLKEAPIGNGYNSILTHELSHYTDDVNPSGEYFKGYNIPLSDQKLIKDYSKQGIKRAKSEEKELNKLLKSENMNPNSKDVIKDRVKRLKYLGNPTETRSRINATRYFYENDKNFGRSSKRNIDKNLPSIFDSEVTPDMIKVMQESGQYKQLQELYTDDQILEMFNTISDNSKSSGPSNMAYAQEGAGVNKEGVKQYKWFKNYMRSPKYKERLKKEFPDYTDSQIGQEVKSRLENVMQTRVGFLPRSSDISTGVGGVQGVYNADEYPGAIMLRPEYSAITSDVLFEPGNYLSGYNTIPLHEWSHAADDGGNRMPQSTTDLMLSKMKKNSLDIPKDVYYYTKPTEYLGRMQPLRYLMEQEGLYDAGTQDFTKEDLEKAKQNKTIKNNQHFQDLMKNVKSDEDFIELMNKVASVNQKDNSRTMMAKNGNSLVELDQLTNFTNYNTPQPGGWLDKY